MTTAQGIGAGGVEFDGSIAQRDHRRGRLSGLVGRRPKVGQVMLRLRIKVSVGADTVIHLAAQQRIDRAVAILA